MAGSAVALSSVASLSVSGARPNLLVYSEYSVLLDALKTVLSGQFNIAVAPSPSAFLNDIGTSFDLVLMDVGCTDQGTLRAIELELSRRDVPVVLLLTGHKLVAYSPKFVVPKAVCYADHPLAETVAVLEAVADGRCVTSPAPTDLVFARPLTNRHVQVLRLISHGLGAKEIANSLGMSVRTAEVHRSAIMDRLGLPSTAELTRFAIVSGIAS